MSQAVVDPTIRELCCECSACPSKCTCFSFRAPEGEIDLLAAGTDLGFTCPRGHPITWDQVRCTVEVDTWGYTIDRNHPLWRTN